MLFAPILVSAEASSSPFKSGDGFGVFVGFGFDARDFGVLQGEAITLTAQSMQHKPTKERADSSKDSANGQWDEFIQRILREARIDDR